MGKDQYWLYQLFRRGVGPDLHNTMTGAPPLFDALNARRSENVDRLLAAGARLDIRDRSGKTPLHQAALVNDPVLVLKFLKAGADRRGIDRLGASFQDYRSEEHTSELQSLMRISYAVFCLKKKRNRIKNT